MNLRVMTYNVHCCIGTDRRRSESRIAEIIRKFKPDVVGLQELDLMRKRTRHVDQAKLIAEELGYEYVFYPALEREGEQYGDAILSRLPFKVYQQSRLPYGPHFLFKETRGAMGVELVGSGVRVINTHLGLGAAERLEQAKALAGVDWLAGSHHGPMILLGDFNSGRQSKPFRILRSRLKDAAALFSGPIKPSYPSRFPTLSLDHIFVSSHFQVQEFFVPKDRDVQVASDHLPVVASLVLQN